MSTKHTPGPWKIVECSGTPPEMRIEYQQDGGNWPLALMEDVGTFENDEFNDVTRANARLIAAAPDLLVAAKQTIEVLKSMGHDALWLRLAIAKAEGK